jgi:hypothetical protein
LLESATDFWPGHWGRGFVVTTLFFEAALLFIAAQSGFLGGPRVLANMGMDQWVPTRFVTLSDRLVTHNGIVLMGGAAVALMLLTHGSVKFLVVLYSMNVFITFILSHLGLTRHWWRERHETRGWRSKLALSVFGLLMTVFILVSMAVIKFHDGGWITLAITGSLVVAMLAIRRHYRRVSQQLKRLDELLTVATVSDSAVGQKAVQAKEPFDPKAKTAVLLVNGFNGLGLHTLFTVIRLFGASFKNYVFIQIGIVDAGNFKGSAEVGRLQQHIADELRRYTRYMETRGYHTESFATIGIDVVDEVSKLAPQITKRYPRAVFFGGQLAFLEESALSRLFHNYIVFSTQRRLHHQGIPFVILPIRV